MHQISKSIKLIFCILVFISSVLTPFKSTAQLFGGQQNPFGVTWRQINTNGFQLIYPVEMETEAQRMANTIRTIFPKIGYSLGIRKTRIPILFQNQGVVANGFVQLGPKKSEFYTTPPQQFDSQDWLNNLAVHELRHVAQFEKLTGNRPYPFPEDVYFAWMGASIPLWFFEGDAVSNETSLTHAGRGRQPSWIMPYRTALLEGRKFSYSKANFGSSKDITPGYYQLGYLMASHIRESAGKFVFDSVLTDIKNRPLRLYPFAKSLKKYSGKTGKEWYDYMTEKLKTDWKNQQVLAPATDYPLLNKPATYESNYYLPAQLPDGKILVIKQSKSEPAAFVLIGPDKSEHRLLGIGQQEDPWYSYANHMLVWHETKYDPRFSQRSYSVICSYDFQTKKTRQLSRRSRISSPGLSADGSKITAVEIDLSNKVKLIVMDSKTGKIIRSYPNPENMLIQTPSFDSSGEKITYVSVTEKGKAIWTVDHSGKTTKVLNETPQQLSRPIYMGERILFNAHYNGIDNIYDLNPASGKINALSASKYGAFNPSVIPGTDSLLFNDFKLTGYQIAKAKIEPTAVGKNNFVYFGAAAEKQENTGNVFDNLPPDSTFASTPYRKLGNLFNVHSVIPVIEDEYKGGIQLVSNNLLSTFDAYAGIEYQRDLKRFEYNAGISFKSLYPIFNLNFKNRPRRSFYATTKGIQQGDWRENYAQLEALLPLSLSSRNHNFNFSVNAGTSFTKRYDAENMPANFVTRINFPLETGFTFSHTIRASERDIVPQWAQVLRLTYLSQPFDQQLTGNLFAAESFFYFPGFVKNHSFLVNFNYQEASGIRSYTNEINTVYGYNNIYAKSRLTNTLLLNYRFPIAFPDAEAGPLAYLRNIRGGVFCHYENIGSETNPSQPKTYGFELQGTANLLRYQPVLDLGTRFVFVNKEYHQNPIFELIVNYTF